MPKVICIYHPQNPEQYIQIYKPHWIAIDCGTSANVPWLEGVLAYCRKKGISVIGWCQNNFSSVIDTFKNHGSHVFFAPKRRALTRQISFAHLLISQQKRIVRPIVFEGVEVELIDKLLKQAKNEVRIANQLELGRVKIDALKTIWKFIRQLEKSCLPIEIYNSEVKAFWNSYTLDEIKEGAETYAGLVSSDEQFYEKLKNALAALTIVYSKMKEGEPPYWTALSTFILEKSPANALRVILFSARSQKHLFAYTLLSRFNISEEEVYNHSFVSLRTIKEFSNPKQEDVDLFQAHGVVPIFVGIPDSYNNNLFCQIINRYESQILIYPHQVGILNAILKAYNKREKTQIELSVGTLSKLSSMDDCVIPEVPERYDVDRTFTKLRIESKVAAKVETHEEVGIIEVGDLHSELAQLLENTDDNEDMEALLSIKLDSKPSMSLVGQDSFLVDSAIEIHLSENHRLLMAPDDQVNIVKGGEVQKVYVRSITQGTTLLCIQGQAKNDLFDLLVDRVHNHPSLAFHFSLLQKWRTEFHVNYLMWKKGGTDRNLNAFWEELKSKGSSVQTPLTVSNWLHGHTMRPQDIENIQRVGEVLNSPFIEENYKEIAKAASRLVGLHMSLSRKLKKWLSGRMATLQVEDQEIVDESLGITFGELRSSMKILQVTKVNTFNQQCLRSSLGILQKIDHHEL